ncbi:MAG TPA: DUF952 domain-containing protein [Nocardioidaceae bacterium]|nr:DUF952 domain-containing protein [Nocardioidaceae bacterium]
MTEILHITERSLWDAARERGTYDMSTRGRTLAGEGFVHCSTRRQLPAVAEALYDDVDPETLVVLIIDGDRLTAPVRYEAPTPGDERFPHVYGPIPVDAVVRVEPWVDWQAEVPERYSVATVYPDMWVDPDDDPREGGPTLGDERTTLLEYLRDQRLTFEMKCDGLDAEQMARRSVPPSTMSLLGLVRHLAAVEHSWFRRVMDGQDIPRLYRSEIDRDLDFNGAVADPAVVDDAWRTWRAEMAFTDEWIANAPDLGVTDPTGEDSLREVVVHLIREYARHCGHADLLRERIDGRTGQ